MKKRILCILLILFMLVSLVPQTAYAMVGAVRNENTATSSGQENYNGWAVRWIQNDYLRLYVLRRASAAGGNANTYLATVPARTTASAKEAYDMVFTKGIYQRPYFTLDSEEISWDTRNVNFGDNGSSIIVKYALGNFKYSVTTTYSITALDAGVYNGQSSSGHLSYDDNDKGRTYGVRCAFEAGYYDGYKKPWMENCSLQFHTQMKGFTKMGHESAPNTAGLYMSTATGSSAEGYTHTSTGIATDMLHVKTNNLSWWSTPSAGMQSRGTAITEVMTKGYSWANPFAALSDLYSVYVDGHYMNQISVVDSLSEYFSTTKSGDVTLETPLSLQGYEKQNVNGATLWGYRDLYKDGEEGFTPNDNITISEDAKHLGIYKVKGKKDKYQAVPASSESELTANQKKYGDPVAVIRGDYYEEKGSYVFSSGVAALSQTITAVWPVGNGSFSVDKDGNISLSKIALNAPTFKFYQDNGQNENGLSMKIGENGLEATIVPSANSAVMSIDIPGTTITVEGTVIKPDGSISFTGKSEFSLFKGTEFDMKELGYGLKGEDFKINGIQATGSIDTAEMLGLEMAKLKGEINTFNNYYHFEMELNVFDLFEAEAELELKRFDKTGTLMPNKLYFFAGSSVAKIPLVSPVIVAHISGAGGGFDGLADSFNGDFFAIPPLNISITGRGDVLNTIETTATYTFGPAYFKMVAEDVNIKFLKKLNLIDSYTIYEGVQGETRNHEGTNYTGLSASGGVSVHMSVPQSSKIIRAGGELNASVFSGLDSYKTPTKIYVIADMNGNVYGSLHAPDGWPIIGGMKLAGTNLDFFLGANTVMNVKGQGFDSAVSSAFKNFKIYGGVKKDGSFLGSHYRVWYIFPDNEVGHTTKILKSLPEWNWDEHKPSGYSASYNEEGGALAVMNISTEELDTVVTQESAENRAALQSGGSYSKTVTLTAESGQSIQDAGILMMVTPTDANTDIDEFAKSLSVSKDGAAVTLTFPTYNDKDEITNESKMTAYVTQNGDGKDCVLIGLGDKAQDNDSWTVTSTLSDFDASLNASQSFDSLSVSLSNNTVSGKVENATAGTDYVLATYLGSKKGATEYIMGYEDVSNPDNISVKIPNRGTMLPTGDYYVMVSLLNKTKLQVEDEDGKTTTEEVLLPVDTVALDKVSYTNTVQPATPTSVTIKPVGNEIMNASWSEVESADGYRVTIYQKDGSNFVDTGKGYSYDAEDIKEGKIAGIAYDKDSNLFTLDMALTVGGVDIDENGNKMNSSAGLDADKTYKIGVQAYKYLTDEVGGKIANSQVYSEEKLSASSELPKYNPLNFSIKLQTLSGSGNSSGFVDRTVTEENGVFTCVTSGGDNHKWYLTPSCEDTENITYTVTRMDTNAKYTAQPGDYVEIDNEKIAGSVMFQIVATVDRGGYSDTTTKYLLVEKDDTAPMISIDEMVVYADSNTGDYTITGLTEPYATVYLNDYNQTQAATADKNGKFSYTGQLQLTLQQYVIDEETGKPKRDEDDNPITETVRNESGEIVYLFAKDENGNSSAMANAVVTLKPGADTTYTVTFDSDGGTGVDPQDIENNGIAIRPADPTKTGYIFNGWYNGKTEYDFTQPITENLTLTAKWTLCDHTGNTAKPTCTEPANCTICNYKIPANGHDLVHHEAKAATCTANGWEAYDTCKNCDYSTYQEIPATGHNVTLVAKVDATCTTDGKEAHYICICGKLFGDAMASVEITDESTLVIPATGHHTPAGAVIENEVAATCTEGGSYDEVVKCSGCGKILSTTHKTTEKLGHSFGDWEEVTSPNCTDKGSKKRTCSVCAYSETKDVNPNGHSWESDYTIDKEATCKAAGSKSIHCSKCDAVKDSETIPAIGHDLVHHEAKAATAAEVGNIEYWYCDNCDKYFSDETGTKEIEKSDTIEEKLAPSIIAGNNATVMQGENKDISFTSNAAFDDFIRVEVDGATVDESNYIAVSGSTIVTLKASYFQTLAVGTHTLGIVSQNGTATTTFTIKATTEATEPTDPVTPTEPTKPTDPVTPTEPTNPTNIVSSKTGDNSNLALWIALLFVSGAGIAGTIVFRKRRKSSAK